jgi:hypothetical protein
MDRAGPSGRSSLSFKAVPLRHSFKAFLRYSRGLGLTGYKSGDLEQFVLARHDILEMSSILRLKEYFRRYNAKAKRAFLGN